eukprot:8325091-Pyramimonas_sp.AAC.1
MPYSIIHRVPSRDHCPARHPSVRIERWDVGNDASAPSLSSSRALALTAPTAHQWDAEGHTGTMCPRRRHAPASDTS